jgi:hypothetical protein
MTAPLTELNQYIGRTGRIRLKTSGMYELSIPVVVTDARDVRLRIECEVTPVGGSGTAWMNTTSIIFDPAEKTANGL